MTNKGRLEICANNVWFFIFYDYSWYRSNSVTATTACRLLGYNNTSMTTTILMIMYIINYIIMSLTLGGSVYTINYLDSPQLPVYPYSMSCSSSSETLLSCVHYSYPIHTGSNVEVGISCTPQHMEPGMLYFLLENSILVASRYVQSAMMVKFD